MLASRAPEYDPQARAATYGCGKQFPQRRLLATAWECEFVVADTRVPHLSHKDPIRRLVVSGSSQQLAQATPSSQDCTAPPHTRHSCGYASPRRPSLMLRKVLYSALQPPKRRCRAEGMTKRNDGRMRPVIMSLAGRFSGSTLFFHQQSLLQLLLTLDAMRSPGDCVQALGLNILAAVYALAVAPFGDSIERLLNQP